LLEQYKQAFDKITPTQELIDKTAEAMERLKEKQSKRRPLYLKYCIAGTACLLVLLLCVNLFKTSDPWADIFSTELVAGQHQEYVALQNSFLSFSNAGDTTTINPPINLSGPGIIKERWSRERYIDYLGASIDPAYLPKGLILEKEEAFAYISPDSRVIADVCTINYSSATGQTLQINVSKDKLPLNSHAGAKENSNINGQPLTVGYAADSNKYWAQFILNGVGYYIESTNLTQEEFIKTIYKYFL
jgi:hypothetical protein